MPEEDLRADLLEPSDTTTHCPFKGDATYRSLRVGDRVVPDAVWAYPTPIAESSWLAGRAVLAPEAADRWLDEDDEVLGHLPDPYHRVNLRNTSRHVTVATTDGVPVADAAGGILLGETGLVDRFYIARDALRGHAGAQREAHRLPLQGPRHVLLAAPGRRARAHRRGVVLRGADRRVARDQGSREPRARRPGGHGELSVLRRRPPRGVAQHLRLPGVARGLGDQVQQDPPQLDVPAAVVAHGVVERLGAGQRVAAALAHLEVGADDVLGLLHVGEAEPGSGSST